MGDDSGRIGPDLVPALRSDVATVPIDAEAVLYEQDSGRLHRLDPVATVVCARFDGEATLTDIVDALARDFGTARDVVDRDVTTLVRTLEDRGLLADAESSS